MRDRYTALSLRAFKRWAIKIYPRCQWCDCDLTLDTATADHLVPVCNGGNEEYGNLVLACEPCNTERGCKGGGVPKGPNWKVVWDRAHHPDRTCVLLVKMGSGPWRQTYRGPLKNCEREAARIEKALGAECTIQEGSCRT